MGKVTVFQAVQVNSSLLPKKSTFHRHFSSISRKLPPEKDFSNFALGDISVAPLHCAQNKEDGMWNQCVYIMYVYILYKYIYIYIYVCVCEHLHNIV